MANWKRSALRTVFRIWLLMERDTKFDLCPTDILQPMFQNNLKKEGINNWLKLENNGGQQRDKSHNMKPKQCNRLKNLLK